MGYREELIAEEAENRRNWLEKREKYLVALRERLAKFENRLDMSVFELAMDIRGDELSEFLRGKDTLTEAQIDVLIELLDANEEDSPHELLDKIIPDQNTLFRFEISGDHLTLRQPPEHGTDFEAVSYLRDEILNSLNQLKSIYSSKPNRPQTELFSPIVDQYSMELEREIRGINFIILYARGIRFYSARTKSDREIGRGEWPEFDIAERDAIDAICDVHGALMMQSAAGRKIVTDAKEFQNTPEEEDQEELLIAELGADLVNETDILDDGAAEVVATLTMIQEDDEHATRTRRVKFWLTCSLLTVVVGGGGVGAGVALATGKVGIASGLAGVAYLTRETLKATQTGKEAIAAASETSQKSLDASAERISKLLTSFLEKKRYLIQRLGDLRPEFQWVKKIVDDSNSPRANNKIKKRPDQIALIDLSGFNQDSIDSYFENKSEERKNIISFRYDSFIEFMNGKSKDLLNQSDFTLVFLFLGEAIVCERDGMTPSAYLLEILDNLSEFNINNNRTIAVVSHNKHKNNDMYLSTNIKIVSDSYLKSRGIEDYIDKYMKDTDMQVIAVS